MILWLGYYIFASYHLKFLFARNVTFVDIQPKTKQFKLRIIEGVVSVAIYFLILGTEKKIKGKLIIKIQS